MILGTENVRDETFLGRRKQKKAGLEEEQNAYREPLQDVRRLLSLTPERIEHRMRFVGLVIFVTVDSGRLPSIVKSHSRPLDLFPVLKIS